MSVGKVRPQLACICHISLTKASQVTSNIGDYHLNSPINCIQLQAVNLQLFKQLIIDAFTSSKSTHGAMMQKRDNLSSEEDNAIRYATGFITTKLMKKDENMKGEKAAQFVECLMHPFTVIHLSGL